MSVQARSKVNSEQAALAATPTLEIGQLAFEALPGVDVHQYGTANLYQIKSGEVVGGVTSVQTDFLNMSFEALEHTQVSVALALYMEEKKAEKGQGEELHNQESSMGGANLFSAASIFHIVTNESAHVNLAPNTDVTSTPNIIESSPAVIAPTESSAPPAAPAPQSEIFTFTETLFNPVYMGTAGNDLFIYQDNHDAFVMANTSGPPFMMYTGPNPIDLGMLTNFHSGDTIAVDPTLEEASLGPVGVGSPFIHPLAGAPLPQTDSSAGVDPAPTVAEWTAMFGTTSLTQGVGYIWWSQANATSPLIFQEVVFNVAGYTNIAQFGGGPLGVSATVFTSAVPEYLDVNTGNPAAHSTNHLVQGNELVWL